MSSEVAASQVFSGMTEGIKSCQPITEAWTLSLLHDIGVSVNNNRDE